MSEPSRGPASKSQDALQDDEEEAPPEEWMRIQRMEFANAFRHWDEDDWKQVMFSDESQEHGGVEDRDH